MQESKAYCEQIVRECLVYPSPTTFSRIIGLTNRALKKEDTLLPQNTDRYELYSGMDLSHGVNIAVEKLKSIKDVVKTTHVYFTAYTGHGKDFQGLKEANVDILSTAVKAVDAVCPNVAFWTLQTGGKAYGVEFVNEGIPFHPPLKESTPRIPEPYASNIFYYPQYDTLRDLSKGKSWKFCEIRPDAIIGFVPNNNAMNLAQALALFLSMYASVEGRGSEVPYPGTDDAYKSLHTDTSQDILARFHIHASLHPDAVNGRAFNVADGEAVSWEAVWPEICKYFGLNGVAPDPSKSTGAQWMREHRPQWAKWIKNKGLKEGALEGTTWDFMGMLMGGMNFDRQYDLGECRKVGFKEEIPTAMGYALAFDRMREAKIIP
ncbi:MAG: hypothetical protein OHK93_003728 [Ramalina farinacea]|uniref:PRISE-like Rossmann-fold domain-containing protein n=1 Tax=Ramalina farinacea TaxID=258253 RepID=A0AA43QVT0_9LECA|nr:hypothetical protein [Ramalina farinacea]